MNKEEKLEKEMWELINEFYGLKPKKGNEDIRYENLKTCREDIIRGLVVSLHLSIEEILEDLIWREMKRKIRSRKKRKEFNEFLHKDLQSRHKLYLARLLGIINTPTFTNLGNLNSIRNKCVHNWILNIKLWRKEKKKRKKKPFVEYNNKNLFDQNVFLGEFLPEYSKIYLKLFMKAFPEE